MIASGSNRTLAQGDFINWYRIERVLGQGGFGITYLATDTNLDHLVALKEYLPTNLVRRADDKTISPITDKSLVDYEHGLQSFLREARTLVKFRHPNIVRVMSVFEANNSAYLVMEYERGVEFREYVKQNRNIGESELINLFLHIIDGLDQVHQTGYLHRDIKPVNVIIRDDGSPVLLDFGSSRRVDNVGANTAFVSAGYTALEQYREGGGLTVGPWTDIYALGGTLYFAIGGDAPVSPVSRLAAHVRGSVDPLTPAVELGANRFSVGFLQAIDWALSFQIADRPQSLAQWRAELERLSHADKPETTDSPENAKTPVDNASLVQGDVVANNPVAPGDVAQASKLRVRNRPPVREASREKSATGQGKNWLPVVSVGALVSIGLVIGTIYGLRVIADNKRLDDQLTRSEAMLDAEPMPLQAIEGFQRVLGTHPDNARAQAGMQRSKEKLQSLVKSQIDDGQIDAALTTIQSIQQIGGQTSELTTQLDAVRLEQTIAQQLGEIRYLNSIGRFSESLQQIEATRSIQDDSRLDELEQQARAGIERTQAEQRRLEAEQRRNEENRRAEQARIAEATKRQRARRVEYSSYLSSVESALLRGDNESARRWLESAKALQIDDQVLVDLDRRVNLAENFASQPLTDYEIRYATGRFNELKKAIEARNLAVVSQLSEGQPSRQKLFDNLFERYTQLSLTVIDVDSALNPKRVTATLRLQTLALANGDIVYPAASYRDIPLSIQRNRYSWSRIQW